jgi:hypothetical protein
MVLCDAEDRCSRPVTTPLWDALQVSFHCYYVRIRNSWFVVWGKQARGLGEIDSWFGGSRHVV